MKEWAFSYKIIKNNEVVAIVFLVLYWVQSLLSYHPAINVIFRYKD